jgi:hypothetical protein
LFPDADAAAFRQRWIDVQAGFVDDPQQAVAQGDALVAEVMHQLASAFAAEKAMLEAQWAQGQEVGTEELRLALQRYRSFFDRLLAL